MSWWWGGTPEHDEPPTGGARATHVAVAIVGAGFAGLGAAIALEREGRRDFVVLERSERVGGTWHDNTYPGVACDIPSHLYSYSFAPNPGWSRLFAPGAEIREYLERTADVAGVLDRVVGGTEVLDAAWDAAADCWRITTTRGDWTASALVLACGRLVEPRIPDLPGMGSFDGPIFHTARWRHDVALAGRRVAVVGTGASAIQLVPELEAAGASVTVLQRSAPWVMPRGDHAYDDAELARFLADPEAIAALRDEHYAAGEAMFPQRLGDAAAIAAARARALGHLRAQVADPRMRERLAPDGEIGCRRVLFSDEWYPAIASGRVDLEPSALVGVEDGVLVAASGRRIEADVLVLATGFVTAEQPYASLVRGIGGQTLAEHWSAGMTSHASTVVNGFPNCFIVNGPNASLGHNSSILMIETQLDYVLTALDHLDGRLDGVLAPAAEAEAAYTAAIDEAARETVWLTGGCHNWYVDERTGRLTLLWPGTVAAFREHGAVFDRAAFEPDLVDAPPPSV